MTVFADTFYFLALMLDSDRHHSKAVAFSLETGYSIVTTQWVLLEVANFVCATPDRSKAPRLIQILGSDPKVRIIPANNDHFQRGLERYTRRPDKDWSLTDCISFIVMEEQGLTEALTGDHHFEQAGFLALLK